MYIGKSVLVQHRVATGHARVGKLVAPGVREHLPVPTELQTHHAIVIAESFVPDGEPRLTVVYKKDDGPLSPVELQSGFLALYDVPHKSHDDAAGELFWLDGLAEAEKTYAASLQTFADSVAGSGEPSQADLDAVAEEEKIKAATSGEQKPAVRVVKGSKGK